MYWENSNSKLDVQGLITVHNGVPWGYQYMNKGSLCIGDCYQNFGNYNNETYSNLVGLMLECGGNTEIVIHHYGTRLLSFLYCNNDYFEYGRSNGSWGHPNAHYFRCESVFECYLSNSASGWQSYRVEPTSLWGDGVTTASEYGGSKYSTMRNLIWCNPHAPSSVGAAASIRLGRAGGILTGTWWEIGTLSDGEFHIGKEANSLNGLSINTNGGVAVGNISSIWRLNVDGAAYVSVYFISSKIGVGTN